MTIDLKKYLPDYYAQSRQMKAIQDASGEQIPDIQGGLWKTLFLSHTPDEFLNTWLKELDVETREDGLIKLRTTGSLNREMLQKVGMKGIASHIYSPEDGYELSGEYGVFPDGKEYAPLISWILADPDNLENARRLVNTAGLAGFKYMIVPNFMGRIIFDPKVNVSTTRYIQTLISQPDKKMEVGYTRYFATFFKRNRSWFNPLLTFDSKYTWLGELPTVFGQISKSLMIYVVQKPQVFKQSTTRYFAISFPGTAKTFKGTTAKNIMGKTLQEPKSWFNPLYKWNDQSITFLSRLPKSAGGITHFNS